MTAESRAVADAIRPPMRALWSALDAVATPASTLVILAVLVRALSHSDYGILVMALAASGLSMAINPAVAATTTKFVSELSARPEQGRTLAGVVTTSLMTVGMIDAILLLATVAFSEPLSRWVFGASVVQSGRLGELLVLAVLAVGMQQIETVLSAAIRGLERFRRQALIELVSRATLIAVLTCVAWRTRSLQAILISQCVVYVLSILVRGIALARLLPHHRLFDLSGRSKAGGLIRYGGWMWLTALAGAAYTSVDRIILGRTLGTSAAGQYNIYVQITQLVHFIPNSMFAFSFPAFARLAAERDPETSALARLYRSNLVAIGVTGLSIAAAMSASWPALVRVVAGSGAEPGSFDATRLLILNFLLLAFNIAPYYLLLALGRARSVSVICTLSMALGLLLMMTLIPRYGFLGAAVGRMAYGTGALLLLVAARRALRSA